MHGWFPMFKPYQSYTWDYFLILNNLNDDDDDDYLNNLIMTFKLCFINSLTRFPPNTVRFSFHARMRRLHLVNLRHLLYILIFNFQNNTFAFSLTLCHLKVVNSRFIWLSYLKPQPQYLLIICVTNSKCDDDLKCLTVCIFCVTFYFYKARRVILFRNGGITRAVYPHFSDKIMKRKKKKKAICKALLKDTS